MFGRWYAFQVSTRRICGARTVSAAGWSASGLRTSIEEGFDNIAEVDDEIRGIVARNWPHLLSKLPPEED
jgi:hypothetical protein